MDESILRRSTQRDLVAVLGKRHGSDLEARHIVGNDRRTEPAGTGGEGLHSHIAVHHNARLRINIAERGGLAAIEGIINSSILSGGRDSHQIVRLVEGRRGNGHIGGGKHIHRLFRLAEALLRGVGRDGAVAIHGQRGATRTCLLSLPTIRYGIVNGGTLRRGAQGDTIAVLDKRYGSDLEVVDHVLDHWRVEPEVTNGNGLDGDVARNGDAIVVHRAVGSRRNGTISCVIDDAAVGNGERHHAVHIRQVAGSAGRHVFQRNIVHHGLAIEVAVTDGIGHDVGGSVEQVSICV